MCVVLVKKRVLFECFRKKVVDGMGINGMCM